jgi:RNA polymerase sigma-70 factor (sigma-E family)
MLPLIVPSDMEIAMGESGTRPLSRQTFEEFFGGRYEALFRTMCLLARSPHEAEDLAQEAFSKLWERWDRVVAMRSPEAYLHRVAVNAFLTRRRRASMALRRGVFPTSGRDEMARVDQVDVIVQALRALSPRQRAAVVLVDVMDYSSEEAAAILGVRASTVRVLAARARAALEERIDRDDV